MFQMGKWTNFKKEVKEEVQMLWKPVLAGTVIAFLAIGVATGIKAATNAVDQAYKDFKKAEQTLNKNKVRAKFLDRGTPTYTVKKADWYVKECMQKQNLWLTYIYTIRYGVNINSEQLERLANLVTRESYEYKATVRNFPQSWQTTDPKNSVPFETVPVGTVANGIPKEIFDKKIDILILADINSRVIDQNKNGWLVLHD
jgi:hypothetical protein